VAGIATHPAPVRPRGGKAPTPPKGRTERYAAGKALRRRVPRETHGEWPLGHNRRDPVELVIESNRGRIPELIPIRYERMMVCPFTFYRGTANIMAADLALTPVSGLHAQLCGDAHLLNFGGFATPERNLILDINDFDETLPGPWEWDLKRLATSFVLAARANHFSSADERKTALACLRSYRKHMVEFANMSSLDIWYALVGMSDTLASAHDKAARYRLKKRVAKAQKRSAAEHHFLKLARAKGGQYVIEDAPPLIYHHPFIENQREGLGYGLECYRKSLSAARRTLLDRYRVMDIALKVVGVGSVGTLCAVVLTMAADDDWMFLQLKEARPSILEAYVSKSAYDNHGERVVVGQHLMQAASDIFLGWFKGPAGRHFYVRQLRDMKLKPQLELFNPVTMLDYATL